MVSLTSFSIYPKVVAKEGVFVISKIILLYFIKKYFLLLIDEFGINLVLVVFIAILYLKNPRFFQLL